MAKLYGKGTITEIVKGKKYRLALSAGKDPITGKYLRHQETFLGTKRQAQLRIEQIRRELESGKRIDADKVIFADWCERYMAMRAESGKLRPKTIEQDRTLSKHLLRGLGSAHVVDITPAMVEELYSSMRKAGVGDTTVKQCHKMLKRVLAYAVRDGIIVVNPVDRVDSPKAPKPSRRSLSVADANRLSAICASGAPTANKTAAYLGLALGCRLGETLGLTWGHVELSGRPFVHVCQQFTAKGEIGPLKTDKDDNPVGRIVPIDASTVAVLKAWKAEQRGILNELGIEQGKDTPIVSNALGGFSDHHNFERWWRPFCVEHGFARWVGDDGREVVELVLGDDAVLYPESEYIIEWRDSEGWPCDESGRRFSRSHKRPKVKRHYDGLHYHELRHTHFTMRLADGMDIPTAQALGGWSTPAVLLTTYAHPLAENIWASAGFMDKLKTVKQTA